MNRLRSFRAVIAIVTLQIAALQVDAADPSPYEQAEAPRPTGGDQWAVVNQLWANIRTNLWIADSTTTVASICRVYSVPIPPTVDKPDGNANDQDDVWTIGFSMDRFDMSPTRVDSYCLAMNSTSALVMFSSRNNQGFIDLDVYGEPEQYSFHLGEMKHADAGKIRDIVMRFLALKQNVDRLGSPEYADTSIYITCQARVAIVLTAAGNESVVKWNMGEIEIGKMGDQVLGAIVFHLLSMSLQSGDIAWRQGGQWSPPDTSRGVAGQWATCESIEEVELGARSILDMALLQNASHANPVLYSAVVALGDFGCGNSLPALERLANQLPNPNFDMTVATRDAADLASQTESYWSMPDPKPHPGINAGARYFVGDPRYMDNSCSLDGLADAILQARLKIGASSNSAQLADWALAKKPGRKWALYRLGTQDEDLFVNTLMVLLKNPALRWARSVVLDLQGRNDPLYQRVKDLPANEGSP